MLKKRKILILYFLLVNEDIFNNHIENAKKFMNSLKENKFLETISFEGCYCCFVF